jgi:hypothetical protein
MRRCGKESSNEVVGSNEVMRLWEGIKVDLWLILDMYVCVHSSERKYSGTSSRAWVDR